MIIFKDSEDNIITKVNEGCAIKFHNEILINPLTSIKEGDSVMLWTDENLKEYQTYYDGLIQRVIDTADQCVEMVKERNIIIEELKTENKQLKKLNKRLIENSTD